MIHLKGLRLEQSADLKRSLQTVVTQEDIKAGSIASCVGCVSKLRIRLAGATKIMERSGHFEIVSLMGTVTPLHQHIHISVADTNGKVWGGHLLEGTIVDTTAELLIHHYTDHLFSREFDITTGYTELVIEKK